MRMSCNGCRVLRKGCSENCTIRPCLQWIKSPEAQGHATVFLAKFYGRAGLLNLIAAGPDHLRPAVFRSLLYEACGRIVNPIFGSVGLLWSGNWNLCQAAVEAVLKGLPIVQLPSEKAAGIPMPPLEASDIRHVSKNNTASDVVAVAKTSRKAFKRAARRPECSPASSSANGSMVSVETAEAEAEQPPTPERRSPTNEVPLDLDLELTLGLGSPSPSTTGKSASSDLRRPSSPPTFSPVDLALSPATC